MSRTTQFIIADGQTIWGVGDTPEAAYHDALQWTDSLPAFEDLPRRNPNDGRAYIAPCSPGLASTARDGNPDGARWVPANGPMAGVEMTPTEYDLLEMSGLV